MTEQVKTVTFKNFADLKQHIAANQKEIEININNLNGLIVATFGAFPKDVIALVNLVEKVIDLKEQDRK